MSHDINKCFSLIEETIAFLLGGQRSACIDQIYHVGIGQKELFLWAIAAEQLGVTHGED